VKALSLWQPWAALVAIGAKRWETRSWAIPANGEELAIHAAKLSLEAMLRKAPGAADLLKCTAYKWAIATRNGFDLEVARGALICVVKPVETLRTEDALRQGKISEVEYQFGDYSAGRFCTRLEVLRVFDAPIPCVGRQKIFNVDLVA